VEEVREQLKLKGDPDFYWIVEKKWPGLMPRELNPDDPHCGPDHLLILQNLKPDYVLLPSGKSRPSWCGETTKVQEWK
jgi:hypothetical protein